MNALASLAASSVDDQWEIRWITAPGDFIRQRVTGRARTELIVRGIAQRGGTVAGITAIAKAEPQS